MTGAGARAGQCPAAVVAAPAAARGREWDGSRLEALADVRSEPVDHNVRLHTQSPCVEEVADTWSRVTSLLTRVAR